MALFFSSLLSFSCSPSLLVSLTCLHTLSSYHPLSMFPGS